MMALRAFANPLPVGDDRVKSTPLSCHSRLKPLQSGNPKACTASGPAPWTRTSRFEGAVAVRRHAPLPKSRARNAPDNLRRIFDFIASPEGACLVKDPASPIVRPLASGLLLS